MTQPALRRPRLLAFSPVVLAALLFTCLPARPLAAAVEPTPKVDAAQLREHLDRLGEVLDQRLERLERLPAEQRPSEAEREADATGFRRYLSALEAMVRRAAPAGEEELLSRIRTLERRVGELEHWSETSGTAATSPPAPAPAVPPGIPLKDAPANDFCSAALPIGIGSVSGSTLGASTEFLLGGCNSSFYSSDVWYRFSSPLTGRLYAAATSSEFEPLTAIYTDCPELGGEYVGCGEAAPIDAEAGTEYLIRVYGRTDARGNFTLTVGSAGSISGTVTAAATGAPLPAVRLAAGSLDGYADSFALTETDGSYTFDDLGPGRYRIYITYAAGYRPEIYDNVPCPLLSCDLVPATPVTLAVDQNVTGIDFALEIGGSLSGTVTDAVTGEPIAETGVGVLNSDRAKITGTNTDAAGRYTFSELYPGNYFVISAADSLYRDEIYDDVPCPGGYFFWYLGDCDFTTATAVPVTLGDPTEGIDFALQRSGSISGTVTEVATGDPIPFVAVEVFRSGSSSRSGLAISDGDGNYTVSGLPSGVYLAQTSDHNFRYLNEIYDDQPCVQECDPMAGTPLTVHLGETTSGIDFSLRRLGVITGAVTDSATGAPISDIAVSVYNEAGDFVADAEVEGGLYQFEGLASENHFLTTNSFSDDFATNLYLDELYDDLPCPHSVCDPTLGTPVRADIDEVTSGIDFALAAQPSISGRVTLDSEGDPLGSIRVVISHADGHQLASATTDETGAYTLYPDALGTYYVWTDISEGSLPLYYNEVYDNILCPPESSCDLTLGTPITVGPGAAVQDVDFALSPRSLLGVISGTVTETATGFPIEAHVTVWDENGSQVARVANFSHFSLGPYRVVLAPGRYYLTASAEFSTHLAEAYDDLLCPLESCDPTAGAPITVGVGTQTTGIDFALDVGGGVYGKVTDEHGRPLIGATLEVWDIEARPLARTSTRADGTFLFNGMVTGSYFVTTRTSSDPNPYLDEVFDNLPCSPAEGCDPTIGTPIMVTVPAVTPHIDFTLAPLGTCSASSTALCLNDGRFRVEIEWSDFDDEGGAAQGEQLTDDSGYFYFLDSDNVEVVVKVLRACFGPTPRYWVFAGGLTNVAAEMTVTDTVTGQSHTYDNPLGTAFELVRDTETFAGCNAGLTGLDALAAEPLAVRPAHAASQELASEEKVGSCVSDATTLCLRGDRFAVTADWASATSPATPATAEPLTADTGYFTFLDAQNVEVVIKVLDACGLDPFHNFWVFATGLTDLEVELRVRDTVSGEVQSYTNALGDGFVPVQDTLHFATCP